MIKLGPIIDSISQGMTLKEFLAKYLKMFGVLVFVFYYTYPQALDVFGRFSFIVPSAAVGASLYAWKRFPFIEVVKVIAFFALFLFWGYFCEYMHERPDPEGFRISYTRSQMAWFFSAYLANFMIFNVHKNPRFEVIVGYIAGAVTLQCIITFAMNQNEWANEFFYSLQMKNIYTEEIKEMTEEQRLLGYGTAFFGGGMVAGYALILLVYLISKIKLSTIQFLGLAATYCFVFFIGLFTARTTTIGLAASIGFLFLLYFVDQNAEKKQPIRLIGVSFLMFFIGAGLATQYFPDYTDWAFEMFNNFQKTGKFSTSSSNALYMMFNQPSTFQGLVVGVRGMDFWGNDMGYTRLIFYSGYIGVFLYFGYQFFIVSQMLTKDLGANLLGLTIVAYSMVMNVKGFTDLNPVLYLLFFFFLFYKYYRYLPNLYMQRLIQKQEEAQKALDAQKDNNDEQ